MDARVFGLYRPLELAGPQGMQTLSEFAIIQRAFVSLVELSAEHAVDDPVDAVVGKSQHQGQLHDICAHVLHKNDGEGDWHVSH
jgi:hypothetical protein